MMRIFSCRLLSFDHHMTRILVFFLTWNIIFFYRMMIDDSPFLFSFTSFWSHDSFSSPFYHNEESSFSHRLSIPLRLTPSNNIIILIPDEIHNTFGNRRRALLKILGCSHPPSLRVKSKTGGSNRNHLEHNDRNDPWIGGSEYEHWSSTNMSDIKGFKHVISLMDLLPFLHESWRGDGLGNRKQD